MAAQSKKSAEDDGGEFADFMADISQEIAQRVESLDPATKRTPEKSKTATPVTKDAETKRTPEKSKTATPVTKDAGLILEWENLADRMIEEMR